MPRPKGKPRSEKVMVVYSTEEFQHMKKLFARSLSKTISGYVRKVSLEEPVHIINRNVSFDAFIGEIVQLRKQMESVRQLAMTPDNELRMIHLHEEIKLLINKIADLCMPK